MTMAASLIAPAWLLLSALGFVVLILHVRRRRTIEVPSIQLWRHLDGGAATRQHLRLPSPSVLLMLQLLFVFLTALALTRPWLGTAPRIGHDILVLDLSDGIAGADGVPNRFDAAVTGITAAAAEVGGRVSLIAAGPRPQLIAARLIPPDRNLRDFASLPLVEGAADWTEVTRLVSAVRNGGRADARGDPRQWRKPGGHAPRRDVSGFNARTAGGTRRRPAPRAARCRAAGDRCEGRQMARGGAHHVCSRDGGCRHGDGARAARRRRRVSGMGLGSR